MPQTEPSREETPTNSNPSSGGSGLSSSSNSTSSDVVGYGETIISIESPLTPTSGDMAEDSVSAGSKLAKTGGFIGTVAGYLTGIALVAAGLVFVFGRRKKSDNEE